jgi:hypothetical protein
MLHAISTVVVVLIAVGLYFRRRPELHVKFMTAAFVTDLALVVWIEATRGAVETVVARPKPLVWFHAGVSVAVLVLYVVQLTLGRRLLYAPAAAGPAAAPTGSGHRALHRNLGITFCVLRGLNYVTAFML